MKYRVVASVRASADLRSILDYLSAEVSPDFAVRLTDKLTIAVAELGDNALRHALVPGHEESRVRRRVAGSYNIYYVIQEDVVSVLHVLHHARDHERLLFPDD